MTGAQIDARFFAVADLMAAKNNTSLAELMAQGIQMNPMQDQFDSIRAADERSRKKWGKDKPASNAA
jgi:hypothetical protein